MNYGDAESKIALGIIIAASKDGLSNELTFQPVGCRIQKWIGLLVKKD